MLILQIALGIVLAIFILANLEELLALGLMAIVIVIGIATVFYIFSILPEFVNLVFSIEFLEIAPVYISFFSALIGTVIYSGVYLISIILTLAIIGAASAEFCQKILGFKISTTTKISDLMDAKKYGSIVLYKVSIRYFCERFVFGFVNFIVLVLSLIYFSDLLNDSFRAGVVVFLIYFMIFVIRKAYVKIKKIQ